MEQEDDPLWYKDAIIYELHVKTFFDGNDDGVGDFPGLISKLDYLQELGVNTLWLLPFYPSPGRDDGYDIADYHNVHPDVGEMADFHRFVDEAHRRGLRVITELVINHTSDQHPWFQTARRSPPGSSKRDYYVWSDTDTKYSGTRSVFTDTEKSNWEWDEEAQAYYWHRFFSHQPDLNFASPHVFKAMMHVMGFWLDAGVDGLRLDAVPYLCERDGTNSENLPETHAVIKHMRAELDSRYHNRAFLAEANQWPEDVREYFGDGDACHMAFHFPLMPRMYMAMAQEDRHPIVEIMEQTPDIPDNCQWAIFLRNHDELTLEMVTDRERDYLYQTYAIDPQARLNLGIRRRLAPLLDNDRHRIELMNLLLMTMPGSPILYYGDEIGMGDNLLLGDRNGVRTPMQWRGVLNGGFSTADPDRLFSPPIVDPMYGFAAVNVESQHRSPSSLLNWTRRLIAMRKAHRAFGRGTLRFLRPGNRNILAYLREHEKETILCVANLSRAAQAVELDLSAFKGRVPVELMGRSKFPPVGELPYLLTLSAHGFHAFRLAADVEAPVWHEERPVSPDLPVLVLIETGWRSLFGTEDRDGVNRPMVRRARAQLVQQIIPRFFRSQPWFLDKDAALEKFELGDVHEWSAEPDSWLLATVVLTLANGEIHRYAIPLTLAWEDEDEGRVSTLLHVTLAKVRRRARMGVMFDAFWDDAFCHAVVSGMERGSTLSFSNGQLQFQATSAFPGFADSMTTAMTTATATTVPETATAPAAMRPTVTRTVSEHGRLLVNLGDQLVLKGYRWLLEGVHPELEMSRFLTETAKFTQMAQLAGTVEYSDSEGHRSTLAILERYAKNQGSAWTYTLAYLERFLDQCRASLARPLDARHAAYMDLIKTLGLRTAEFHQALALPDTPVIPAPPVIPDTPVIPAPPVIPNTPVIPAKAGIQDTPVIPAPPVIPAKAGIQDTPVIPAPPVIPAKAGIHSAEDEGLSPNPGAAGAAGAFGSEPITADDITEWVNSVRVQLDAMYVLLEAELPQLPDAVRPMGNALVAARRRLYRRIRHAAAVRPGATGATKARCHGDYHLGQVWLSNNDFLITNYGTEPGRPWAERRWKHTPLRDVAGMLFSFSQAAAAALDFVHGAADSPETDAALRQVADTWQALANREFLKTYRRAMKGHALFPSDARTVDTLVTLFMVEKAAVSLSGALAQRSKTMGSIMGQLIQLGQSGQRKR